MNAPEPTLRQPSLPSGQIPAVYFNGFQIGLSNADISALLMLDNEPALKINMSYTTAKTLHTKLGEMVSTLERVTGREIMTTEDTAQGLETLKPESAEQ